MNSRRVVPSDDFQRSLSEVLVALDAMQRRVTTSCLLSSTSTPTTLVTQLQAESSLVWRAPASQLIYDTIIDHCTRSEREGPGSFQVTLRIILQALKQGTLPFGQSVIRDIVGASYVPSLEELQSYLQYSLGDENLTALVLEVLATSGLEGKVFFEMSNNETLSVELVNGFNFTVNFPFSMLFKERGVKVLIVDGLVESVSEVHHLLQKFSETKETLVFIARGFADDVINTFKVNYDRKTLNIIPVSVKFDFDGINTLADLGIVCGTDIVSSAQGHLISSVRYEDIVTVPFVSCAGKTLTIVNDATLSHTQLQVKKLLERRKEAPIEDLALLFDTRIKSLTPCCTKVRVPDDRRFVQYSEMFDVSLRLIKSAIRHGMVSKARLPDTQDFEHFMPFMALDSAIATLRYSTSCFNLLTKTAALIA